MLEQAESPKANSTASGLLSAIRLVLRLWPLALAFLILAPRRAGPAPEALGLRSVDVRVGTGREVFSGARIYFNYHRWLADGRKLDPHNLPGPLSVQVGKGDLVPGLELGIRGMRVGGIRRITVPPELAYKDASTDDIPPNSTIIYELELLEVE